MSGDYNKPRPKFYGDGRIDKKRSHQWKPKAQEKKVAAAVGGKRVMGSGSGEDKSDVSMEDRAFPLRIECKRSSGKQSIRLEAAHLTKISAEAMAQDQYPALDLQFDQEVMLEVARKMGRLPADTDWIAIPLSLFQLMLEALGEEGLNLESARS